MYKYCSWGLIIATAMCKCYCKYYYAATAVLLILLSLCMNAIAFVYKCCHHGINVVLQLQECKHHCHSV